MAGEIGRTAEAETETAATAGTDVVTGPTEATGTAARRDAGRGAGTTGVLDAEATEVPGSVGRAEAARGIRAAGSAAVASAAPSGGVGAAATAPAGQLLEIVRAAELA